MGLLGLYWRILREGTTPLPSDLQTLSTPRRRPCPLLYGKLWTDSQRRTVAFLRTQEPVAPTTTFLVYDFRRER
ncbi:MAG: hypothetical protein HY002_09595 [Candidatus Rokubacteria bacterium]|nr:hypothetical protein [Candidatus Rokubacteria bacterium]